MKSLILAALGLSLFACSSDDVNCAEELKKGRALQILPPDSEDSCDFEGTAELSGSENPDGEISDLVCKFEEGRCTCSGGDAYGVYRVYITDTQTDSTYTALLEADAAPTPQCTSVHAIESFRPVGGMGGAGGMGGSSN